MVSRAAALGVTAAFAAAGFFGNLHIVLCLILSRSREGREGVTRAINLAVGAVSALHACTCVAALFFFFCMTAPCRNPAAFAASTYMVFSFVLSSICVMSLLFLLYRAGIVPVRSALLARARQRFLGATPWLVAGCLLLCFSMSAPYIKYNHCSGNSTADAPGRHLFYNPSGSYFVIYMAFWMGLLVAAPFTVMVFSSVSVLLHLRRHMQRLRGDSCGIASPRLDREQRAARLLFHQLLLYSLLIMLCAISMLLEVADVTSQLQDWYGAIPCLYCANTSANLILRNGRLRTMTALLLRKLHKG
ncbi:taste receptor type 2 member 41-like [Megalops cyprinoides]|uniref:taste receptor type 2 member 41-like n=1 Tax=Megalops cyprinoides TaxID=118141 RepID=UPI001864D64A|nr:taste receptor type 2 member 41-like [Megalops cyprinoides]